MKHMEFPIYPAGRKDESDIPPLTADDFADIPEVYALARKVPIELQQPHFSRIEHLSKEEAVQYLSDFFEQREGALRESFVSEPSIKEYFETHEKEIWHSLETRIFTSTENSLGAGQTARVKRMTFDDDTAPVRTLAIKYLVTPTEKTLSASGEHDLIREVEQIREIEDAERTSALKTAHFRVPHPYFYYKKDKIQCYGMEEIFGVDLRRGIEDPLEEDFISAIRESLRSTTIEAIHAEIDLFFDAMHTVCLHGDMKPANLMVSSDGHFYVIDFGQSVRATDVNDKAVEAFENLKSDEKEKAKICLTHFFARIGI